MLKVRHWARKALKGSAGDTHRQIQKPEQACIFDYDLVLADDNAPLLLLDSQQNEWVKYWTPPKQNVSLIPKPTGGERPITLTPFVHFMWAPLRRPLGAEWDEKAAGIRGNNA